MRAQAVIQTGVVRLCNGRMERRWSTFTGATTEFYLGGTVTDCLTRKSPEYHLDYGERSLGVLDLGEVFWSEACDERGATATLEQAASGLAVRLHTFLAHGQPWMTRLLEVTNTGCDPVRLTRVAADVLPLDPKRFRPGGPEARDVYVKDNHGHDDVYHYHAVDGVDGTVYFGAPSDHGVALFSPNPRYCASVWTGSVSVIPGKTWSAPPVSIYWASGPADTEVTEASLKALHAAWRKAGAGRELQNGHAC